MGDDDFFDVALEDTGKTKQPYKQRVDGARASSGDKREKKNAKFGFGGRKRFSKSGDAISSGDIRQFSTRKMKSLKKDAQRSGKSRREMLSR